jgi:hypothetical protein
VSLIFLQGLPVPWKSGGEPPHSKQELFGGLTLMHWEISISRRRSIDCGGQDSPKTEILIRDTDYYVLPLPELRQTKE